MEVYLFFAVLAALIFASASLLSKHYLDIEIDDHLFAGSVFGLPFFLLFIALGVYRGNIIFSGLFSVASFSAGALYSVILILYLRGLSEEEASRFIPTIALNTIFLAIMSFFLLGQKFSIIEYLGMFLAVSGSILISLENPLNDLLELHSEIGTILAVGIALLIAFRDTMIEFATQSYDLWSALLWMGAGGVIFSLSVIFLTRRNKFAFNEFKGQSHMLGVGSLRSFGFLAYTVAISLGPAAKASAILKLNGMLVFMGATLIGLFRPGFIEEDTGKWKVFQKFIASSMIIAGVLLVR
ncbi:MAG: EamA family transporter [Candidatus Nanohaloarchaea archaeon]